MPAKNTRVKTTDADHCLAASTTVGMTHENSIHSTTRIPHTALQDASPRQAVYLLRLALLNASSVPVAVQNGEQITTRFGTMS